MLMKEKILFMSFIKKRRRRKTKVLFVLKTKRRRVKKTRKRRVKKTRRRRVKRTISMGVRKFIENITHSGRRNATDLTF